MDKTEMLKNCPFTRAPCAGRACAWSYGGQCAMHSIANDLTGINGGLTNLADEVHELNVDLRRELSNIAALDDIVSVMQQERKEK